jgi:hypothetical protein
VSAHISTFVSNFYEHSNIRFCIDSQFPLFAEYYCNYEFRKNETGEVHDTFGDAMNAHKILAGYPERQGCLEDLLIDGSIILTLTLGR